MFGRRESERVTHIALAIDGLQQPVSHLLRGCGGRCHCLLCANRPTGEKSSGFKGLMDGKKSQASRGDRDVAEPHVSDVTVGLKRCVCVFSCEMKIRRLSSLSASLRRALSPISWSPLDQNPSTAALWENVTPPDVITQVGRYTMMQKTSIFFLSLYNNAVLSPECSLFDFFKTRHQTNNCSFVHFLFNLINKYQCKGTKTLASTQKNTVRTMELSLVTFCFK